VPATHGGPHRLSRSCHPPIVRLWSTQGALQMANLIHRPLI
jgi:hypothetical protein